MKKIVIDLSEESFASAISELAVYNREIKPRLEEVCRRLAQIGADEAKRIVAQSGNYGNGAATVSDPIPIGNGYKVSMSGSDIYFIEFGTGNQVSPHGTTDVPVAWGSWSAEHSQKLWKYGFWYFQGEKLEGTPAYKPLFYAEQEIRHNAQKVIDEVFGK